MSEREVRKLLDSLKVDLHLKKGLTPEEINQELDRRYDNDFDSVFKKGLVKQFS